MPKLIYNRYIKLLERCLVFIALLLCSVSAAAQHRPPPDHDTSYITTFPQKLVGRVYLTQKYTTVRLQSAASPVIRYRPNTSWALGVGASYHALTLNFSYGFGFLNNDKAKGKTHGIDLQTHLFKRNWRFDFIGQYYHGYYLYPQGLASPDESKYYLRPDMRIVLLGIGAYHLFNGNKFSYRASLVQTEWQKKSSGSFLAGGQMYYGQLKTDSAFIPSVLDTSFYARQINKVRVVAIAPGIGYTYTYVYKDHFFATGTFVTNLAFGYSREYTPSKSLDMLYVRPEYALTLTAGYNSRHWTFMFAWLENRLRGRGTAQGLQYQLSAGNYYFTAAKRIDLSNKTRKKLKVIDDIVPGKP